MLLIPKSAVQTVLKTRTSWLMLFSLLAQSCTTISALSQRNDQSLALPRVSNQNTPGDANIEKVNIETKGRKKTPEAAAKHALRGTASWYGPRFHGKKTASGEIYHQAKFPAAHKAL